MNDDLVDGTLNPVNEVSKEESLKKMIPQHEIDAIVKAAKRQAADSTRREMEEQFRQQQAGMQQQQQQGQPQQQPQGLDREELSEAVMQQAKEKLFADFERQQMEQEMYQVAHKYTGHVEHAKNAYSDYDTVMKGFKPEEFKNVIFLTTQLPNGGDVLYELAKDPDKLDRIHRWSTGTEFMTEKAMNELNKLSQSIAANQAAIEQENSYQPTSAPLDQMQPSKVSSGSNGEPSIKDLRNNPLYRR